LQGGDNILMKNTLLVAAIVALVFGAAGFLGGLTYQKSKQAGNRNFAVMGGRVQGQGTNRLGVRPVAGEIISNDNSSITVKLPDGSSRIVLLTASTSINKADTVKATDLTVGSTISAFGTENADGSVTAQNVQLNPIIVNNTGNQGL